MNNVNSKQPDNTAFYLCAPFNLTLSDACKKYGNYKILEIEQLKGCPEGNVHISHRNVGLNGILRFLH